MQQIVMYFDRNRRVPTAGIEGPTIPWRVKRAQLLAARHAKKAEEARQ